MAQENPFDVEIDENSITITKNGLQYTRWTIDSWTGNPLMVQYIAFSICAALTNDEESLKLIGVNGIDFKPTRKVRQTRPNKRTITE